MKLALISGGSKGLGAALGSLYRSKGWRVIEFSRSGSGEGSVAVDLARPKAASSSFAATMGSISVGEIDELVAISNAARLGPVGPLLDLSDEEILGNIDVNIGGGMLFMKAVLNAFAMAQCDKTLVNISSGAAQRAVHGWSLYCAAKAGLDRFVQCLAVEQSGLQHPFSVINLSPGVIDTDMQAEIRAAGSSAFPDRQRFVELKEQGNLRSADAVAALIALIIASRPASGGRYEVNDFAA